MTVKGFKTKYPRRHEQPPKEGDNMLQEFLRIKDAVGKRDYLARFNPSYLMFNKGE